MEKEGLTTAEKNKIKPDTILKNFWRNNDRFADLFNAVFFGGELVIKPEDLVEADTDVSSVIKFNGHAETVQRIFDVVKKTAYGVDFVIWGLENQSKIHYAMPLRHMVGDALSYLKECKEIEARNEQGKKHASSAEFLSKFKKTDRLHPVISLCVYYGENEWDGPFCLKDMLKIPEKLSILVSDYKMNLLQIRKSGAYQFHNSDVDTVFDMSRSIYEEDYGKINTVYKERKISPELGMVIGAITESQKLIDHALESEEKGERMDMCNALEKLVEKGRAEGEAQERARGIQAVVGTCKRLNTDKKLAIEIVMKEFSLSEEEATAYVEKCW